MGCDGMDGVAGTGWDGTDGAAVTAGSCSQRDCQRWLLSLTARRLLSQVVFFQNNIVRRFQICKNTFNLVMLLEKYLLPNQRAV